MKLIIVESPKKAKTIKKFLNKRFIVLASYGHILDLPKKKFGIYLKEGKLKYQYQVINWRFIKGLKSILRKSQEVYLATDPDREGEFIAWSISQYLKNKKFYRIRFYEISKKAIYQALNQLDEINQNLVSAQQGRRFLDRIVGYSLSPLLWKKKIGQSAGRVQSAALRLIVDREKEIIEFKPEIYYQLEIDFGNFSAYLLNQNKNYRFEEKDKKFLEKLLTELKSSEFIVNKVIKDIKNIKKPTPLDTALLQRVGFSKYRFSAPLVMSLAQSLYEKGIITYHRTDSFNLSSEFLSKVKNYLKDDYQSPYLIKKKFSQEAHEAIRPIYLRKEIKLPPLELKLYHLIFDYTLASSSQSAIVEEMKYYLVPEKNKNLIFEARGENLVKPGFLKYHPLPFSLKKSLNLKEGEKFIPKKINLLKKETQPPPRYNEASLIKTLKELGIGRPSTYAAIINILLKRNYIKKIKNYLQPTEIGKKVIDFLNDCYPEIIDLQFTAKMEESLDKIALGQLDYEKFIIDFWQLLKNHL
jgi:DNA topoisomerase-1